MKIFEKNQFFNYKKIVFIAIVLVLIQSGIIAQNISINTSGSSPSSSAILDVSSNNKGILIPRMTNAQRQALKDPATGLIIYNTSSNQFNYYDGSGWYSIPNTNVSSSSGSGTASGENIAINTSGNDADPSAMLDIASTGKGILIPRTTQGNVTATLGLIIYNSSTNRIEYYNGSSWNTLCNSLIDNTKGTGAASLGVAINSSGITSDASAILDISSSDKGILIPRMTSVERSAIKSPANGLMVYNTTTNRLESWSGSAWYELQNDADAPTSPTAATHTPSQTQIVWNWNATAGASGYRYNTVNNYNTSTDNGTNTSFVQASLTCNTAYTLYVWAYNDCGSSSVTALNETTSACGPVYPPTSIHCIPGGATIQEVTSFNGRIWMDRNIGASRKATSASDAASYGDLYQWGRFSEGHQCRTSAFISANATTPTPSLGNTWDGKFANGGGTPSDWLVTQDNSLWQGVSGTNNPCPSGFRIPTQSEWIAESDNFSPDNRTGAYNSLLKLPSAGYRIQNNGNLTQEGNEGTYWSSTVAGTRAAYLHFRSTNNSANGSAVRPFGYSIRCIKD